MANTLYKLYAGCWATRLTAWITTHEALHPAQKGFTPHGGGLEHNFMLKEEIRQARTGKQELRLVWLDISNAFGAIPEDLRAGLATAESFVRKICLSFNPEKSKPFTLDDKGVAARS